MMETIQSTDEMRGICVQCRAMPGMQGACHNDLDPILNDDVILTMLTEKMMMKIVITIIITTR